MSEDPEVTKLKAEIAELEASLSTATLSASNVREKAGGFSKDAYVRLAAEADNFKKTRLRSSKDSGEGVERREADGWREGRMGL